MLTHPTAIPSHKRSMALATEVGGASRGAPLGPDSLTWRYLGDARNLLLAGRAGVLQTMHPAIDAGVRQHSDFFVNPLNRIIRSAGPILGVVYDEDWQATGHTVRDFHRPIKGTMRDGRRYAALDPDTYFWAHATFFEAQIATQQLFGTPLTAAERSRGTSVTGSRCDRFHPTTRPSRGTGQTCSTTSCSRPRSRGRRSASPSAGSPLPTAGSRAQRGRSCTRSCSAARPG
jgi:hypothetical protein